MSEADWVNILIGISGIPSLVIFVLLAIRDKSLSRTYFALAIFSLLSGIALSYVTLLPIQDLSIEWGNLLAIVFVLCALFVVIRNSKPVFARFPLYMTGMPLLGVLFYPLINDATVVKDLLMILYQGGALLVGILIFGINQFILKNRTVLLVGVMILSASYATYWFVNDEMLEAHRSISMALLSVGMLVCSLGLKRISDKDQTNKN